ncbi:hypothetical protein [Planobispora longispora]|uniref:SH3 domain-containing protein n=1 Tax=Planobispora longispora TaxID=28887 RepID=A0A8J3W731_9ACTN|nr:hypothetical protein [Planobispora longispora]BFE83374.1 hypothetical protein GCM10020093_059750 [Planobispora longispora]GIH77431.1 hypothetical protein Plo01_38600 [Planobispora longispora]
MIFKRLAGVMVAAAVAGGGSIALSAATATAAEAATCAYRVRNVPAGSVLAVRDIPRAYGTVVDSLLPSQITFGKCALQTKNFRAVVGRKGVNGYSHKRYLKKLSRLS